MNGYLRIKNTDLYERDGVTYWRNGGNIIGNVVKAVIEEDDVITSETYYIKSLKTAKAIMLDPDVKIGGLTASESKNGNFIIVATEPADFTEYGGGAGLKITFIYGVNYYSIETVESNGDIKIYDPDGESGTITPDALPDVTDASAGDVLTLDSDKKPTWDAIPEELPDVTDATAGDALILDADKKPVWGPVTPAAKYVHNIKITKSNTGTILFKFIDSVSSAYSSSTNAIKGLFAVVGNVDYEATGLINKIIIESLKPTSSGTCALRGSGIAFSNNDISITQDDLYNLSTLTGYSCTDTVYEI